MSGRTLTREERIAHLSQFEVYDFRYFIKPRIKSTFPNVSLWRTGMRVVELNGAVTVFVQLFFHNAACPLFIAPRKLANDYIDGKLRAIDFYEQLAESLVEDMLSLSSLFV